jgi:hypothetical protein
MSIYTVFLNLLKKNPTTEGTDTFNIETMLNENWEKIDVGVKAISDELDTISVAVVAKETPAGAQTKATAAETAAKAYADAMIAALVDSSPAALNTLNELAEALGDDPNFRTTVLNQIAAKADASSLVAHLAENVILIPKAGSTANAILLDIALTDKKKGSFLAANVNTGNMTINGKAFKKDASTQIAIGGVKAGKVYDFYYDQATDSVFILAKATGTAQPSQVLADIPFSNGDGEQVGTMPNGVTAPVGVRAQANYVIYKPTKGYYDGNQEIYLYNGDFNALNFKVGTAPYGLAGTLVAKIPSQIVAYNNLNQLGMTLYYRSDIDLTFNISSGGMNVVVGDHGAVAAYLTVYSASTVDLTDVQFITIQFSASIGSTGSATPTIQAGVSLVNTDNATFAASASFTPPATQNTHVTSAVIDVRAITGPHYLKIRASNATYSGVNNTMTVGSMFLVQ